MFFKCDFSLHFFFFRICKIARNFCPKFSKSDQNFFRLMYVKRCEQCQKHGKMQNVTSPELQSVSVPTEAMKQIGVDICNLPEVDGYKHLVVCIDYFSKWSEAKPLKDKLAASVSLFLYEVICRHDCIKVQINDQGREFVNDLITKLHEMTGVEQRVTSAYHPQANGLCERQNRTIKDSLVKVLNGKLTEWPYIIEGVLFAHRVSKHSSTKYSPFYLMYNQSFPLISSII